MFVFLPRLGDCIHQPLYERPNNHNKERYDDISHRDALAQVPQNPGIKPTLMAIITKEVTAEETSTMISANRNRLLMPAGLYPRTPPKPAESITIPGRPED